MKNLRRPCVTCSVVGGGAFIPLAPACTLTDALVTMGRVDRGREGRRIRASTGGQREFRTKGVPPSDAKNLDWRDWVGKHASSPARFGTRRSHARRTGKEGRLLAATLGDEASARHAENAANKVPV